MDIKKRMKGEHGLTLIEILIGIVITALMMGAMYTSYNVVNKTYNQVSEKAKISKTSRDLVSMLMRDIRMAGYKYYAGSYTIEKFAKKTDDNCTDGIVLPKTSYFPFENGYDDENKSHNPIVIRKKLLGNKYNYDFYEKSRNATNPKFLKILIFKTRLAWTGPVR